jgi:hypothetical protein
VNHQVDSTIERRLQAGRIIRQEVVSTTPAFNTRARWEIEAEVCVGEK